MRFQCKRMLNASQWRRFSVWGAMMILGGARLAAGGEIRFDFESGDMQGWTVTDGAFDQFVCNRAVFHNGGAPYNKQGTYFLTTLERADGRPDDGMTGVAVSPVFVLEGPAMRLRVGGGDGPEVGVALCTMNGAEVLTARGANTEAMQTVEWNAPQLVGKRVYLKLVDQATGGWGHLTLDEFVATGRIDPKAPVPKPRNHLAASMAPPADPAALRSAIEDLIQTHGAAYPRGPEFLDRLAALEPDAEAMQTLAREALLANPLLAGKEILFVVRHQYKPDHHNTATLFQTGEVNTASFQGGGALKALDLATGRVRTLLEAPEGVIRDPEVHFDGQRILFSMRRNIEEDYKIFEIGTDGTGLRQLTFTPGVADIDPLYLPDGRIIFASTRDPKYCMCNVHIMANLYRMEGDGSNLNQIGKNTLFEGHPQLLEDGRILYDRWEYVDRNFGDAQGLWACNPDGTAHVIVYGNNTPSPGGVIDARAVPGTGGLVLGLLGSCHDRPWGTLALIDRRRGVDGPDAIVRTWPAGLESLVKLDGNNLWDAFIKQTPKYEDPWPLSGKTFLCARMTGQGEQMGLYLVDLSGNEVLIHTEAPGCYDPMVIASHPRPPVIPDRRDYASPAGTFYILNVYEGAEMNRVAPGAVKRLRVVESPEKRVWSVPAWGGQGVHRPAMNWHDFNNKRILGTVPVEEDGSAYFEVPANRFVYLQLLDDQGMMVQSMRSGTYVQPGEQASCVGCHENRLSGPAVPVSGAMPLALKRPPDRLQAWQGPERLFDYMTEVQPVLDRNCIACHDYGPREDDRPVLARDRDLVFNASYNELWRRGLTGAIGAGPAQVQPPYAWGSHASPLIQMLQKGHHDVKLDAESMERLITWVDLNAPFYPDYTTAYPDNFVGRAPLDNQQLARLAQLTGMDLKSIGGHASNPGPQVSFDRPALSPCLAGLEAKDPAAYAEALAIVQAGAAMLASRPPVGAPGFQPNPVDAARLEKNAALQRQEARFREAIATGKRLNDMDVQGMVN